MFEQAPRAAKSGDETPYVVCPEDGVETWFSGIRRGDDSLRSGKPRVKMSVD